MSKVDVLVSASAKSVGVSFEGLVEDNTVWEKSVSECRRYVEVSVRAMELIDESDGGKGRESRYKRSRFLGTEFRVCV